MVNSLIHKQDDIRNRESGSSVFTLLVLYIICLPLNNLKVFGSGSLYKYVVIVIAGLLLFLKMRNSSKLWLSNAEKAWGIYLLIGLLCIAFAENRSFAFSYTVGMFEVYIVSLLFLQFSYSNSQKIIIEYAFVFTGLVYLLFMQFFSSAQIYTARQIISFGKFGEMDPNEWCAYLILPVAVCTDRLFTKRGIIRKVLSVLFVLFCVYGVFRSGSRGGILCIGATFIIIMLKYVKPTMSSVIISAIVMAVGAFVIARFIIPLLPDTVLSRYTRAGFAIRGGSGRLDKWNEVLTSLWNHPIRLLTGYGMYGATSVVRVAHNYFLQTILDTGMFGLMAYIVMLVRIHRNAKINGPIAIAVFWGIQVALLTLSGYGSFKAIWMIYTYCLFNFYEDDEEQPRRRRIVSWKNREHGSWM